LGFVVIFNEILHKCISTIVTVARRVLKASPLHFSTLVVVQISVMKSYHFITDRVWFQPHFLPLSLTTRSD